MVSTRDSFPAEGPDEGPDVRSDDLEDEALRWAGDEDRGAVAPRRGGAGGPQVAMPSGAVDPSAAAAATRAEGEGAAIPASGTRTAATAFFAVVYLALVLGWVLSVQSTSSGSTELFVDVTWQFGEFLALISGVLWFGAVLTLTRTRATAVRVAWWLLGVAVLVPWPLVLVVIAEAAA